MRRSCLLVTLSLIYWPVHAANATWYVMTRDGCERLHVLASEVPELSDADDPENILAAFRRHWPDATMRPYTEVLAEERKPRDANDQRVLSSFTPQNALWLSSNKGDLQLLFLTEDLCRRTGHLSEK